MKFREIAKEGLMLVNAEANPNNLRWGVIKAVECVLSELKLFSRLVNTQSEIFQIASNASNDDKEIGKLISDAIEKVGKDGVIA